MSISNWGKFSTQHTHNYVDDRMLPIIQKLIDINPTLVGNIIHVDTSFNNISVYGKLNVYNYLDHFISVNDVEYSICHDNSVTFVENTEVVNLPGTMLIDDGRTIHVNNMTQNTIIINSVYKIYHWLLTPPEGLNAIEIAPNMMYKFVFNRNSVTTEGKWSIMC